jgi:C4-dicarboxylate-binding protein DctP
MTTLSRARQRKRRQLMSAALAAPVATLARRARAQAAAITIRFSHVVAESTPKGQAALRFKQLAEERSKGRVRVEVYPNSQLYKDKEEVEALQLGAVQMLAPSASKFGSLGIEAFEVFDLPYIFPNREALRRVTEGEVGRRLFGLLAPKGIAGLAYWDNGFKQMSANVALHLPADFRGLKMRIKPSKVLDAQMRALGALPQVLAFSEVYQALQTGVVDGAENTLPNLLTQRIYEVQKHLTISNHGYDGYVVIANKHFWDGLSPDIRTLLETAMVEASRFENELSLRENEDDLRVIAASGKTQVYTLNDSEVAAWRAVLAPVAQQMEGRIGRDWIDAVRGA